MATFGKIQQGSGARFKANGQPAEIAAAKRTQINLESPHPPMAFNGIKTGNDFDLEYEVRQAPTIDGSKSLLRVLSPFMIQVEPPLIMAGTDPKKSKRNFGEILDVGHSGAPAAFTAARNRIQPDIPGGSQLSYAGSVESFVSSGRLTRAKGGGQGETIHIDKDNPGPGRIGTPSIADLYTAVDITMQLRALVNTPPLVLLINPQSLSMNYTKIQQFTDRTRYGYVLQAWGEEQPKLSVSARCGAFISGGRGVQFASRLDSAAWQNFQTAFQFYKNNGYIYDTVGKSNANHMVGALSVHYDGWVYYGNMETFSYTLEESNQLGGIVFEMEFTINAMVDTSKQSSVVSPMRSPTPSPSDPRYSGVASKALPSEGDLSIGGSNGVQVGGATFYSVNGIEPGAGATTPDGQPAPKPATGGRVQVSPKSSGGFVMVSPMPAKAVDPAERLPTPFGFGR